MKQFIIKLLVFVSLFFIVDRSFILFRYNEANIFDDIAREKMLKIKKFFNSQKDFDILLFGSSHVQFGISPNIITKETGLTSLNIGYGSGANIGKQLNLLKHIVNSDNLMTPRIILFGMDVFTLNNSPVYNDEFQDILFNRSNYGKRKYSKSYITLYSRFIPRYINDCRNNNYRLPYLRNEVSYDLSMFNHFQKYEISDFGWVKGYGELNPYYVRYRQVSFFPDKKALSDLKEFISICKKSDIELVFFQVPENISCLFFYQKYIDFNQFMNKIASEYSVRYIDYNYNNVGKFPAYLDEYFFDSDHLNIYGAKLFTEILAKDILKKLKSTTFCVGNDSL